MTTDLEQFIADTPTVRAALQILSAPEGLTDDLALHLLTDAVPPPFAVSLVDALHLCDFVEERNSEWQLAEPVRRTLLAELTEDRSRSEQIHARILALTDPSERSGFHGELPRYLSFNGSRAYHGVFARRSGSLAEYSAAAEQRLSGQQWLAVRLADEQVELGVIPGDAIEVRFLRGMMLYREGRTSEAMVPLRKVANSKLTRREVAIAAHLVGRHDTRRARTQARGLALLRKSVALGEALDDDVHLAHVLHTLGQVLGQSPRSRQPAEAALLRSQKLFEDLDDEPKVGQVLHTLGHLLVRRTETMAKAEELLVRSVDIARRHAIDENLAQVLHTLGQHLGRTGRTPDAEATLRESLEIHRRGGRTASVSAVLNTLGQVVGRDASRAEEARAILEESLRIDRDRNDKAHQALVLYGMAHIQGTPRPDAEALLRESLAINVELGDARGQDIVRAALRRLRRLWRDT